MLRPRVERLGYLGEFFRYTAHQPQALISFLDFTEDFCTWAIFYGPDGGEEP